MAVAFCAAAGSPAQPAAPDSTGARQIETSQRPQLARADREFIQEAAQDGFAQVQAGKLALAKADETEVRQYARTLMNHHSETNAQLQQLARRKGVAMPQEPSVLQKRRLRGLEVLQGSDFDRRYMNEFGVAAHQSTIRRFREQARQGRDSDVRVFAQRRLATLQKHLNRARLIQASIGANPGSRPGLQPDRR